MALLSPCVDAKLILGECMFSYWLRWGQGSSCALAEENAIANLIIANRDIKRANELATLGAGLG